MGLRFAELETLNERLMEVGVQTEVRRGEQSGSSVRRCAYAPWTLSSPACTTTWDGLALFFHCRVDGEPRPGAEVSACEFVDLKRVAEQATPWGLDRVLDVFEFPGRAVVRSQRTGSPKNYVPVRRGPW